MQAIDPITPFRPQQRGQRKTADIGPPPSPRAPIRRQSMVIDGFMPPSQPRTVPPIPRSLPSTQPVSVAASPSPRSAPLRPEIPTVNPPMKPVSPPAEPFRLTLPTHGQTGLKIPRKSSLHKKILLIVLSILGLAGIAWAAGLPFGPLLVGAYGVAALIKHIPSSKTFVLAMVTLASAVVLLPVFGSQHIIPSAVASCAFLLLFVGAASLGLEMRREPALVEA